MSLIVRRGGFPTISRDNFLAPFDKMFDNMFETNFPEVAQSVGVNPFSNTASVSYTHLTLPTIYSV